MTSKRNLENRIDRIDKGGDYPNVSLCQVLSADEIETVDKDRGLVRIDGTLMKEIPGRELNL
ncbi:hypothetical protein [Natrialba sp. INN-245]|uniref:hypothetical protein n=1 Tax=Natrialba sp. INN-245 TaxID=2690967 RepID=UPI0013129C27|nr:hypothetical protein [Natrialba sp. INN-245]MWV40131.1 hypothetical protein [Natrialba sp. INN-245]